MLDNANIKVLTNLQSIYTERVLTPEALEFVAKLHKKFNQRRKELLEVRIERQKRIDAGELPNFLDSTQDVREGDWQVASVLKDLEDRRVEILSPTDAKMLINALNSGAKVFMADLEDSLAPSWENVLSGQLNLQDAVRHSLYFKNDAGKEYKLKDASELATLLVRPRGWHLDEKNVEVDGESISGSLFDFRNVLLSQRQGKDGPWIGTLLLPTENGKPSRGKTLERGVYLCPS